MERNNRGKNRRGRKQEDRYSTGGYFIDGEGVADKKQEMTGIKVKWTLKMVNQGARKEIC